MREIEVTHHARRDILRIADWYNSKRNDYGAVFESALDEYFEKIAENPFVFPVLHVRRQIRRALMPNFLYYIYFTEDEERILIWTIVHASRSPRVGISRVTKRSKG